MHGQTEHEQLVIKENFERIQSEQADAKERLESKPLTAGLKKLLRALAENGGRFILRDNPQEVATLTEGQVRRLLALLRREPAQPNAPAFLQTIRERGPYLPNEPDPAGTLQRWLANDPETGDRAMVVLTDAGRIEAATLDDGEATPASAPGIDDAILGALRKAIAVSPEGRATKVNAIQDKVGGNPSRLRDHLRHLETLGEYAGFGRPRPDRYKGTKGTKGT